MSRIRLNNFWLPLVVCALLRCTRVTTTSQPPAIFNGLYSSSAPPIDSGTPTDVQAPALVPEPPAGLACLSTYYDGHLEHHGSSWSLVLSDGERILPGEAATLYGAPYPTGLITPVTHQEGADPGAIRLDPLMFATYGHSAAEVYSSLVRVPLAGHIVKIHKRIEAPFRRASAKIDAALRANPSLARFFAQMGGTFNWRTIAGLPELSSHSWGIAIDIDVSQSNYWYHDHPMHWQNRSHK